MAINKASLIIVKGNWLPNATFVESLAIFHSVVVTLFFLLGPEVRFIVTKAIAIKAMVVTMIRAMDVACYQAHAIDAHE